MIARARRLLDAATAETAATNSAEAANEAEAPDTATRAVQRCPCCGGRMIVVETFAVGTTPRQRPAGVRIRIDTS